MGDDDASGCLWNRDVDTPATLRALADAVEVGTAGVTEVDYGHAGELFADDPFALELSVTYIPRGENTDLPNVVQFKDPDDRT